MPAGVEVKLELELSLPPGARWMVWWYGALQRGRLDQTQPKVTVLFRELGSTNVLTDNYASRAMNVTDLGFARLGSVWGDGRLVAMRTCATKTFRVDFSGDEQNLCQLVQGSNQKRSYLFSSSAYPILSRCGRDTARAWMLRFKTDDPLDLLVPCMLFFSRLYGSSEELRRILLTYPCGDVEHRLFADPPPGLEPETDGHWTICRAERLSSGDDLLLAHLKYQERARRRARSLYAQLESADPDTPVFLKVVPWWDASGEIEVSGIPIKGDGVFLALDIRGVTAPPSKPIISQRYPTLPGAPGGGNGAAEGRNGPDVFIRHNVRPDLIHIAEDEQPGREAPRVQIREQEIRWLGTSPVIEFAFPEVGNAQPGRIRNRERTGPIPRNASGGEPAGGDNSVGKASIYAPTVPQSHGMLRDMWAALQTISVKDYATLGGLAYYTLEREIETKSEPKLVPFPRPSAVSRKTEGGTQKSRKYEKHTELENHAWRLWVDIHGHRGNSPPRGVLIARLATDKGYVYFAEIERRVWSGRRKSNGESSGKNAARCREEQFHGLIFTLRTDACLRDWVKRVLCTLPKRRGVFQKSLLDSCPGVAWAFTHGGPAGDKRKDKCLRTARRAIVQLRQVVAAREGHARNDAMLNPRQPKDLPL